MSRTKPTMKSIADELGVSRSTVSFVLGGEAGRRRINAQTAERIVQRAEALGFRPNYFAQALNTHKTGAIGLVFPEVHEAYMSEMLHGIDEVFAQHDTSMMLSSSRMDRALELRNIESLLHRGVDGLILVPCAEFKARASATPSLSAFLAAQKIPVVCADRVPAGWQGNAVVQDDKNAARQAVEALFARGAKRVGCISFDLDASSITGRIAGYRDALLARRQNFDPRWLILLEHVDLSAHDLALALQTLLACPAKERPDAWFVTTTGLSYRTRELLRLAHADAPIARFGTDPTYFASGMISVAQPHRAIGRRAAELLFEQIAEPARAPEQIALPATLLSGPDAEAAK